MAAGATLGLVFVASWAISGQGFGGDFHAYWVASPLYPYGHQSPGMVDAFQYTPAAALIAPVLRLLPFALALIVWRLAQVGAVLTTAGPWTFLILLTYPVASELNLGNINLFIGLAVVAGFRWPAAWTFVLLTKPTCGVGLLWFVVRRDWRALKIVLGLTAAVAGVSFVLAPNAWIEYAQYLLGHPAPEVQGFPVLWVRLPVAVLVAVVAGVLGWRPGVAVAAWLALPVWWYVSPSVLVGALAFTWQGPLVKQVGVVAPSKGRNAWFRSHVEQARWATSVDLTRSLSNAFGNRFGRARDQAE
jgi:hypothetical protein